MCNFEATMFIVPNGIRPFENFMRPEEYLQTLKDVGIDADIEDVGVHVWIHSSESENWQDHKMPSQVWKALSDAAGHKVHRYYPCYIPLRLLKGVKEGDKITLGPVTVTCQQQGYRYRNFGTFEQVLAMLVNE